MKLTHILLTVLAIALIGGLGTLWLAPAAITRAPDVTVTTLQVTGALALDTGKIRGLVLTMLSRSS